MLAVHEGTRSYAKSRREEQRLHKAINSISNIAKISAYDKVLNTLSQQI